MIAGNIFKKRLTDLELKAATRHPTLSSQRRKYLTDLAVNYGDQEALQELNLNRPERITGSKEQREAAVAAGERANA